MKISVLPFALAAAILSGFAVLSCAVANHIWPGYAESFLHLVSSIYPGYHANGTATSVLVGTAYALVDGAVAGAVLAWLYNSFLKISESRNPQH
jgi:hypothetical protein